MLTSAPSDITGPGHFPSGNCSEEQLRVLGVPFILLGGHAINSMRVQEASGKGSAL